MSLHARFYVCGVTVVAAALLGYAVTRPVDWLVVLLIAVLVFVADVEPVLLRRSTASQTLHMTVSFPIRMAAIVLAGPWSVALTTLVSLVSFSRGGRPLVKRVFNAAQYTVTVCLAGLTYVALGGHVGPVDGDAFLTSLLPFAAAALVYYLVNTFLVSVVIVLTGPLNYREFWRTSMLPMTSTYLGYGPVGMLIAVLWAQVGVLAAVLALGPIFIARWASGQLLAERKTHDGALRTFARAVEAKDLYTRGHSERVSTLTGMMGRELGWHTDRVALVSHAGLLHDIGKIRVPTHILQKAGPLTRDEFAAIQLHPVYGQAMMRDVAFLDEVLPGILHHHERLDGAGYPMGLAGTDIPEFARVIAVADALDSMTSTRSYRNATTVADAMAEIARSAGSQFDPEMVRVLEAVVERDGWQPHHVPAQPPWGGGVTSTFDHDDPRRPLPPGDSEPTDEPREPEPR